jgi:hypothetical protein
LGEINVSAARKQNKENEKMSKKKPATQVKEEVKNEAKAVPGYTIDSAPPAEGLPAFSSLHVTKEAEKLLNAMGTKDTWDPIREAGRLAGAYPLFVHAEKKNHGYAIWVGGVLAQRQMRFANKIGTFILEQGDSTAWKQEGTFGGTLTVFGWHPAKNSENNFDTVHKDNWPKPLKAKNQEELTLILAAITAYNNWCHHCPDSKSGSLAGETLLDSLNEEVETKKNNANFCAEIDAKVASILAELDKEEEATKQELFIALETMMTNIRLASLKRTIIRDFVGKLKAKITETPVAEPTPVNLDVEL